MIKNESSIEIARPVSDVFAFVEDFANAARWLTGCVELRRDGDAKNGSPVHYKFKQGPRTKALEGVLTTYERERRLTLSFVDTVFDVVVDLAFSPTATGARVSHSIAIEPKRFFARLLAPLIRGGNRKQVAQNLARLAEVLSASPHAGPASA